jgi:hypothetical protein
LLLPFSGTFVVAALRGDSHGFSFSPMFKSPRVHNIHQCSPIVVIFRCEKNHLQKVESRASRI